MINVKTDVILMKKNRFNEYYFFDFTKMEIIVTDLDGKYSIVLSNPDAVEINKKTFEAMIKICSLKK